MCERNKENPKAHKIPQNIFFFYLKFKPISLTSFTDLVYCAKQQYNTLKKHKPLLTYNC